MRVRILDPLNPGTASNDFIAETTTAGQQFDNNVVAFGTGQFLAMWRSTDTEDLRGRIFDASDPSSAANDFVLASTDGTFALDPEATLLADGRYVVTWRSIDGGDSDSGIRARIFDATGTPIANDFLVNTTTDSLQEMPSITALPGGGFVATWLSTDAESGSPACNRARIFDATGSAIVNDFVVNTTGRRFQGFQPSVAALADGRFMVTGESSDLDAGVGDSLDGDGTCICLLRFSCCRYSRRHGRISSSI